MTNYSSEYSTFYSQSYENSSFLHGTENENTFSITNEFKDNLNSNQGFFQSDNMAEENSFQFSLEEINPWNSYDEEEDEEEKNLYFIKKDEKAPSVPADLVDQQASKSSPIIKFKKFITIEEKSSKIESTQLTKKKRGREKLTKNSDKNDKTHDKFSTDNLLRKIQVHYLTFIVNFINIILKTLNYEQRFFKLDYGLKKNVNKKYFDSLKNKTIGEILCNKISIKYKKQNENANIKVYEQIKDMEILKKILSENYLKLFKKIYFKSNKIINLKEYGLDQEIYLTKPVKMFKDLLKDNEASDIYQTNIAECAAQNYLPDTIFVFH